MKKNSILPVLLFGSFLFISCSAWKKNLIRNGNHNDACRNAIDDFLHSKLNSKDRIFCISINNINNDVLAICILPNQNKISVITKDEIEYSFKAFPTNYREKNGKLFYWQDSTQQKVPQELLDKLYKMNMIDTTVINKRIPYRVTDDSEKSADYFFCKSNLKKYKKVYSGIAIGWLKPPKITCSYR